MAARRQQPRPVVPASRASVAMNVVDFGGRMMSSVL